MTTFKVLPGRLMRRPDYSVHGYAGETIESTDPDYIADPDPTNDLAVSAESGGGGPSGTVGFYSLALMMGLAIGNVTGGGGPPSGTVGLRSLVEPTGLAIGNNASGGGGPGAPTVGFVSIIDGTGLGHGNSAAGPAPMGFASLIDPAGVGAGVGGSDFARITWTDPGTINGADLDFYVDSVGGNDGNAGTSSGAPKQTLAAGVALLRNGQGDRLHLKRGSTFTGADARLGNWSKSGFDATRPMIIDAYGTGARPKIDIQSTSATFVSLPSSGSIHDVWFMSLEIYSSTYDHTANPGPSCFNWVSVNAGQNHARFLFEDLCIHDFGKWGFLFQGHNAGAFEVINGITVRGVTMYNIGHDSTGTDTTVGNYVYNVDNLLIEWYQGDTVGYLNGPSQSDLKRHWYIDNVNGPTLPVLRYSTMLFCDGVQQRCGGTTVFNLFSDCNTAINIGGGSVPNAGGVVSTCEDNVILHGTAPTGASNATAWGLAVSNVRDSSIQRNIIAQAFISMAADTSKGLFFRRWNTLSPPSTFIARNCEVAHNIVHDWGGYGVHIEGTNDTYYANGDAGVWNNLHHNVVQNPTNTHWWSEPAGGDHGVVVYVNSGTLDTLDFHTSSNRFGMASNATAQVGGADTTFAALFSRFGDSGSSDNHTTPGTAVANYLDPSRDVASYHGSIGGTATLAAYVTAQRLQEKDNGAGTTWRHEITGPAVIAHIKAGFTEV